MDIYLIVIVINIEKKNYWNYTYLRKRRYIFQLGCKLKKGSFCVDKYIPTLKLSNSFIILGKKPQKSVQKNLEQCPFKAM